ncbi:unnamed protein product [Calypogeia fissa]
MRICAAEETESNDLETYVKSVLLPRGYGGPGGGNALLPLWCLWMALGRLSSMIGLLGTFDSFFPLKEIHKKGPRCF